MTALFQLKKIIFSNGSAASSIRAEIFKPGIRRNKFVHFLHGKNLFLKNYRIVRKLRIWEKFGRFYLYSKQPMQKSMIGLTIGPSLQCWQPMLVIDIGPMIDRGLDDDCGPILACYIGLKIAPYYRPRITARIKLMTFQNYHDNISIMTIKFKSWRIINTNQYWYWTILQKKKMFSDLLSEVARGGTSTRYLRVCY